MDDIALIRALAAGTPGPDPSARAAAKQILEASIELASAPALPHRSRRRRRSILAAAGVGALATITAVVLALSSGTGTEPAAAEVLHETAAVALSGTAAPTAEAGPGQYYFLKTKEVNFEGWVPGGVTAQAPITSQPGGFSALIPRETELWRSPDGGDRSRVTLGTPKFLTPAEESRWEAASSPLPIGFDTRHEDVRALAELGGTRVLETTRGVLDTEKPASKDGSGSESYFGDISKLPTDPEQLRLAIESGRAPGLTGPSPGPLGEEGTIDALEALLSPTYPNASPALRAAAFDALAGIQGFALNRDATDLIGRKGYSISHNDGRGQREEIIVDPATAAVLGERTLLIDPAKEPQWKGYEAGLTTKDLAYIQSTVVDSTHQPPAGED
jgi:hypothetical protein